jgi:hypothetical protein
MTPISGQIISKAVTTCPCCGQKIQGDISQLLIDHIWNGSDWIILDSWEGHDLAMGLKILPGVRKIKHD